MLEKVSLDAGGIAALGAIIAGVYVANKYGGALTEVVDGAIESVSSGVKNAVKTVTESAPVTITTSAYAKTISDETSLAAYKADPKLGFVYEILMLPINIGVGIVDYVAGSGTGAGPSEDQRQKWADDAKAQTTFSEQVASDNLFPQYYNPGVIPANFLSGSFSEQSSKDAVFPW